MRLEFRLTGLDIVAIVASAVITVLTCLLLAGCSMGIRETYENGVLKEKTPYIDFGMMQVQEDCANIDIVKVLGLHASYATMGVDLGYGMHVRMILKPDANGELPVVVLDTGLNPFEREGMTDTVLTGKEAVKEFYVEEPKDSE
jgi:hypothetical protein